MSTDLETIGRNQSPVAVDRVGQATAVEQARAVAEVAAAVQVAQQVPRNLQNARQQMLDSCQMQFLAERAFFRYNRGGSAVTGETVHLARELARCFGNVQYGLAELRRDDDHGQSEMQAFAWDVQNNTRASTTFIVPHGRDTQQGRKALTDLRDIYENNANMGARRLREQIFAILPKWFIEEAKERCRKTLQDGGGKPLAIRIDELIAAMRKLGVTDQQLVDRVGRRPDQWTPEDVASLGVVWRSISNGEVTREDEFPQARVTGEEITGGQRPAAVPTAPPGASATEQTPPAAPAVAAGPKASNRQVAALRGLLSDLGWESEDEQLAELVERTGRPLAAPADLLKSEAEDIAAALEAAAPPATAGPR